MSKDNLLEILQNNGDLNDVKPNSIMTLEEEIIKRLVEWVEEENRKAKALDEFKNSKVHLNLKSRIAKKDHTMSEEQWERFRQVWESYGVKFQNDDGTYKCIKDVLNEMAMVWHNITNDFYNIIIDSE